LRTDTDGPILPGVAIVSVKACQCGRCEHIWLPRDWDQLAKVCPKCKSPYWNSPRKFPKPTAPAAKKRAPAKRPS
jgi:hypothetical protein